MTQIEPSHDPRTCPLCLGAGHPSTVRENQEERERQIEAIQRDFSSSLRASAPDELERAREARDDADLYGRAPRGMSTDELHRWAAQERERDRKAAPEQERKRLAEEKREQEAREYLIRESERVLREREEREMWHIPQEPAPKPISSAPLIIVRPPSEEAEAEVCKCGYPGCLGHELINGRIIFPGFTSEAAMAQSPHELVCLHVEVTGVPGNPSEGTIPATTIRTRREPRN